MAQYGSEVFHNYDKPHHFNKGNCFVKNSHRSQQRNQGNPRNGCHCGGRRSRRYRGSGIRGQSGADTIFGKIRPSGGMATGGLVNIIPNLGDIYGEQYIGGFCQEVIDRLAAREAACFPERRFWGKGEPLVVEKYLKANMMHFYIRKNHEDKYVVLYTAVIDPEIAKDEMNTMVTEAGAELLLHTWVTEPIMEGNSVKGVIVESKAGRQALLGKVVIDCTGDGSPAGNGTETVDYMVPGSRIAQFGFVYWICNVDLEKYDDFVNTQPEKYKEITREITKLGGSAFFSRGLLDHQEGVVWVHRLIGSLHQTDPEEMTYIDTMTRKQSVRSWELLKKYMPGFEKSFIMLSAPQLGTSGGRRIVGEYFLTGKDMDTDRPFEDTIAIFPDNDRGEKSLKYPRTYIPYRALVPKETEGLLVACGLSRQTTIQRVFQLIPTACVSARQPERRPPSPLGGVNVETSIMPR